MEFTEVMIIDHLEFIKEKCEKLRGAESKNVLTDNPSNPWMHYSLCKETDQIIKEYNWIIPKINTLLKNSGISFELKEIKIIDPEFKKISEEKKYPPINNRLLFISLKCNRILSILKNIAISTKENRRNFEELKKEVAKIEKDLPVDVLRDIYEAIDELELNKILGSVLICGRIIVFNLDMVKGNINEKIEKLRTSGLVESQSASALIIKANKKARELFSHDINYFPNPSDAISILGDTIKISKIISRYLKIKDVQVKVDTLKLNLT